MNKRLHGVDDFSDVGERSLHDFIKSSNDAATAFAQSKSIYLSAPTECEMEEIAQLVAFSILSERTTLKSIELATSSDAAPVVGRGVVIFLQGDLGAGKTTFARGFLRAATGDWTLRVTSPTYLLSNTYLTQTNEENLEIHHMDLYRLSGVSEQTQAMSPLNLDHVFVNCLSLTEWPSRLPSSLIPAVRLEITISIANSNYGSVGDEDNNDRARLVRLTPFGEAWESWLRALVEEGYIDDLIVE